MSNYPLFISVGQRYAFVPEGESVIIENEYGKIVGGRFDGVKVKGVTGASIHASFFSTMKDFKEVDFESLLEETK